MKVIGIIPARMAASRFPGKPLHPIHGKAMLEHVFQRALLYEGWDRLVIATCDQEIEQFSKIFPLLMMSQRVSITHLVRQGILRASYFLIKICFRILPLLSKGFGGVLRIIISCFYRQGTLLQLITRFCLVCIVVGKLSYLSHFGK